MNVLHVFRSPVGGLFRHVCDLVEQQSQLGLKVGIVCDASTGGENAVARLKQLEPFCQLGIRRLPMNRSIGLDDYRVTRDLPALCREHQPDIIHGHGAKGGAYGRLLAAKLNAKAIYTPHGGSLHYSLMSPVGAVYLILERYLKKLTHGIIFESQFSADAYERKIGNFSCAHKVIHNGLREHEFTRFDGLDNHTFVFVGELRKLKGLETLFKAMKTLRHSSTLPAHIHPKLLVFGAGPDENLFKQQVKDLDLTDCVQFNPPIFPATEAFKQAQCMVIPSLKESFPYIVLEVAAARVPLLTTQAGGIPEIFGPHAHRLLQPGDAAQLADAMLQQLNHPAESLAFANELQAFVHANFTFQQMVDKTVAFYHEVLNRV